MRAFSAWKGTNAYDNALKSFGIKYSTLPVDMNIQICSYANQQYEWTSKMFNDAMFGQRYSDTVTLESAMSNAATLVALCLLGPRDFSRGQRRYSLSMDETISDAIKDWNNNGPNSSLETKIIETVGNFNLLHVEFAQAFNYLLDEYKAEKTWSYHVFEDWYAEYKKSAAETNQKLSLNAEGGSLLDYMDNEPLHRAFQDKVDPKSLGKSFAEQYDLSKFISNINCK